MDRFLLCPAQHNYYKQQEAIPLTEYYEYVRRGMYIAGFKWVMMYRKAEKKTRPKLLSFLADYRDRAWRSRPTAVKKQPHELSARKMKTKLYAESKRILSLLQHRIRGAGDVVGVNMNYQLEQLGVYGKLDAVYQDPKSGLHLYYLTEDVARDKYNDNIYLDVLGFEQIYGKKPDFLFLIDILTQRKISLTANPQSDILKSLKQVVDGIQTGGKYKTPGIHCQSCNYRDICDIRKRGNNGS